jgi:hypothetical protein
MTDETGLTMPSFGFLAPPRNLDEAMDLADMIAKSSIVPKDLRGKPGDVLIAIQLGMELGLPWMTSCQCIAVINGRPSIWGDALKGIVIASPLCEYIDEDPIDVVTAKGRGRCKTKRKGKDQPIEVIFTIDDAKKARLWQKQGPWTEYPARMLAMRARSFCLRDAYPDLLRGIVAREEAEDIAVPVLPPPEAPRRSRRNRVIDVTPSQTTEPASSANSSTESATPSSPPSGESHTSPSSSSTSPVTPPESSKTSATDGSSSKPSALHPDDKATFAKVVSRNEKQSKAGQKYVVLTLADEDGKEAMYTSYEPSVVEGSKALHLSGEMAKFWTYEQESWKKVRCIEDAAAPPAAEQEPPQ